MWKYEAEVSALGDPHIVSVWGCSFDADRNSTEVVLRNSMARTQVDIYAVEWHSDSAVVTLKASIISLFVLGECGQPLKKYLEQLKDCTTSMQNVLKDVLQR